MRGRSLALSVALGSFALLGATSSYPITIALEPQHGSHERGSAVVVRRGDEVTVDVRVTGSPPESASQLVHLHRGACDRMSLRDAIDLDPLVAGHSRTTLHGADARAISTGEAYYVSVHKTLANITAHVACGGPLYVR